MPPSFHGNFYLYAMELPFVHSKFTPRATMSRSSRSSATAKPSLTAARKSSSLTISRPGSLHDSVAFTARETADDALYSAPPPSTATPGVTATVALVDHRCCGGFITMAMAEGDGMFKMRRAWASTDGKDEVFEGFFSVDIGYASTCICGVIDDSDSDVVESFDMCMSFWGMMGGRSGSILREGTTRCAT